MANEISNKNWLGRGLFHRANATFSCLRFLLFVAIVIIANQPIKALAVTESFQGSSATLGWRVFSGACLTAGNGTGTIPACAPGTAGGLNGNTPDTAGNGALRLTTNAGSQLGGAFYLTSLPTADGVSFTFDSYVYSGSGGDGFAFSIVDATAGAPTYIGLGGSYLGCRAPGLSGGYVCIGFDELGGFAGAAHAIGVRGPTSGGNVLLTSAAAGIPIWNNVSTRAAATKHTYVVTITAAGILNVSVNGSTRITNYNLAATAGALPANIYVGFTAGSGSSTAIHEVTSFTSATLAPLPLSATKSSFVISDPINGTVNPKMIPGATVRYCIQASNPTGSPTATNVTITDIIGSSPVTFVPNSIHVNGSVTLDNQCNWDGTLGGSYSSGNVTGSLADIIGGGIRTMYFDAIIN